MHHRHNPGKAPPSPRADRASAKKWIIENQLNRRNITAYQRSELVLVLEPMLREKARENQGARTDLLLNSTKGSESIDTREELAKVAGVSHGTLDKVKSIHEHGIEPLQDMARSGGISINAAALVRIGEGSLCMGDLFAGFGKGESFGAGRFGSGGRSQKIKST